MNETTGEVAPTTESSDVEADLATGFAKVVPANAQAEQPTQAQPASDAKPAEEAKPADASKPAEPAADAKPAEPEQRPEPQFVTREELERERKGWKEREAGYQGEIRKNFGQIGELRAAVQDLQKSMTGRGKLTLTAAQLKRVNEELPGLAESLAADLSEAFDAASVAQAEAKAQAKDTGQAFDPKAFFEQTIKPALDQVHTQSTLRAEARLLQYAHPDYEQVLFSDVENRVYTPDFEAWRAAQPPEKQKLIQDSEDAIQIAGIVTEFKAHRERSQKEATNKRVRLEQAITPNGVKTPVEPVSNDPDAEFGQGFNKVHKARLTGA